MSTTYLNIPEDVSQLVVAAAKRRGVTPHAFMVDAIRGAASADEERSRFVAAAQEAREEVLEGGKVFLAADVHAYLRARAQGQPAAPLKAVPWRS